MLEDPDDLVIVHNPFIESHVLESRDAHYQSIFAAGRVLFYVFVDNILPDLVLVDDVMVHGKIVRQNIPDLQDLASFLLDKFAYDRNFDGALIHPSTVVDGVEVSNPLPSEKELAWPSSPM